MVNKAVLLADNTDTSDTYSLLLFPLSQKHTGRVMGIRENNRREVSVLSVASVVGRLAR